MSGELADTTLEEQIREQVSRLEPEQQRQVLDFARALSESKTLRGTPAEEFFTSAAAVKFDPDDLREIVQAIEEDCERIDLNGWQ